MKLNRKDIEIKVIPLLKKYEIKKAALFGSYARGEEREDSDVDILVEMGKEKSLLDLAGLQIDISELLKRKADVITYSSIHRRLKKIILKDARVFYEEESCRIS